DLSCTTTDSTNPPLVLVASLHWIMHDDNVPVRHWVFRPGHRSLCAAVLSAVPENRCVATQVVAAAGTVGLDGDELATWAVPGWWTSYGSSHSDRQRVCRRPTCQRGQ